MSPATKFRLRLPSRPRFLGRRGTTAVEFALVASLAFGFILMTIDIGRYLADQHALDYGVAAAARYAAVSSKSASVDSITSKFDSAASGLLGNCAQCQVSVTFSPNYPVGSNVTVTASLPWSTVSPLTMLGSKTLSSSTTMTVVH